MMSPPADHEQSTVDPACEGKQLALHLSNFSDGCRLRFQGTFVVSFTRWVQFDGCCSAPRRRHLHPIHRSGAGRPVTADVLRHHAKSLRSAARSGRGKTSSTRFQEQRTAWRSMPFIPRSAHFDLTEHLTSNDDASADLSIRRRCSSPRSAARSLPIQERDHHSPGDTPSGTMRTQFHSRSSENLQPSL